MKIIEQKIKLTLGLVVLTSFIFLALFSLNVNTDMKMNQGVKTMSSCPYIQNGAAICTMNIFDHLESWQNSLNIIPIKNIISTILFALVLGFIFLSLKKLQWLQEKYKRIRIRIYEKSIRQHKSFVYTYLFSQGILNPKSY